MSAIIAPPQRIVVPYAPRRWAQKFHDSLKRFAVLIMHRRCGKTTAMLNHHQRAATSDHWEATRLRALNPRFTDGDIRNLLRGRVYWHVMPTFHQGKVTGAWDILKRISVVIPGSKPNEAELAVKYPNGARIGIIGADDPDSLRGPGLSGLSMDEYSQIPANAFGEVLSKSLADHLGYALFSGTIKGEDHLYSLYQAAKNDPAWFSLWQNVDVSLATEDGATVEAIRIAMDDERRLVAQGLMTQAEFDQEWYLSAEAAIKGAFYGDQLHAMKVSGRICRVPYDPMIPVDTDWDLGIDAMAVWFTQATRSGEIRLIDYYENIGGGLPAAIQALKGQMPNPSNDSKITAANLRRSAYVYGEHWGPHDIEVTEIGTGTTRKKIAADLGVKFKVTPKLPVADGITATQLLLSRCYADEENTKDGLSALRNYRRKWNQALGQFMAEPVHDRASHGSDAMRGRAVRDRRLKLTQAKPPYDPYRDAYSHGGSAYS